MSNDPCIDSLNDWCLGLVSNQQHCQLVENNNNKVHLHMLLEAESKHQVEYSSYSLYYIKEKYMSTIFFCFDYIYLVDITIMKLCGENYLGFNYQMFFC